MIENISTDGLYDKSYKRIMQEIECLRNKQLQYSSKLTMLGTNSLFYSIIDSILSPFKRNRTLYLPSQFLLMLLGQYLAHRRKILFTYYNILWDYSTIESIFSRFKGNRILSIPAKLLLKVFHWYFICDGKSRVWNMHYIWDMDGILKTTLVALARHAEYPWAIMNANLDRPMKILDVGGGISLFSVYLASKGHEVFSIDNDKILMNRVAPKLAEWAGTKISYKVSDATKIEFNDNTFDRVFCISVLEHLEEEDAVEGKRANYHRRNLDVKVISEMLRVVKPGGFVILTLDWSENPNDLRSYELDDIYERLLKPYKPFLVIDKKPEINWNELKHKHDEASNPLHNTPPQEGWAMGVVLQKR